jgi:predicted O-methyltransferase YrrM
MNTNPSGKGIVDKLKDKKELIGIEIGVERGENSHYLLSKLDIKKIYLIEPYLPYTDLNGDHVCDTARQLENKNRCLDTLSIFSNYELLELTSDDTINNFKDESIDFIFIDGLHTYEQCKKDINNYYSKIKPGGFFSGHDYTYCDGVNRAVNEFSSQVNKEVLTCDNDVWYWIK